MLISIISAPAAALQVSATLAQPQLQAKLDQLDKKIVETIRETGLTRIWSLLNTLAEDEGSTNRAEGRNLRLHLLTKLQRLKRLGLVFFIGRNLIAPEKPDLKTMQAVSQPRKRTVRKSSVFLPVSAKSSPNPVNQQDATQLIQKHWDAPKNRPIRPELEVEKTESDTKLAAATSAAQALARLPRKRKKWSGYVNGKRTWRDQKIILPDGSVVYTYGALRGQVVYFRDLPREPEPGRWGAVEASQVKLWKNPAAVALGHRKSGVKERRSVRKQLSSQQNGRRPVRPGSRPRGRPRQNGSSSH